MRPEVTAGFILLIAAFLLVICDRVMRVNEGFTNWETSVPEGMCGVDLPPCPFGTACMNGYCRTTVAPFMPATSGLPVKPEGYIRL